MHVLFWACVVIGGLGLLLALGGGAMFLIVGWLLHPTESNPAGGLMWASIAAIWIGVLVLGVDVVGWIIYGLLCLMETRFFGS